LADDQMGGFFEGHPDDHFKDMKRQFLEDLWTLNNKIIHHYPM
jgi:hypothetical protein